MKTLVCLLILLLGSSGTKAQNLILNGDFGNFISCPTTLGMIDSAEFWINATINGTPDYFYQCSSPLFAGVPQNQVGFQQPHSGEGYGGLYLWQPLMINYREYMEGQLSTPLTAGACYHFEMFISLANFMKHTASNIGVFFSDTLISGVIGAQIQSFTPQITNPTGSYPDTATWMQVSGNFTAAGGESFIIIGNFDLDGAVDSVLVSPMALWAGTHVYVDDISLTPCTGINDPPAAVTTHVFPNPAHNVLHVETNDQSPSEIIIYNYAHQVVLQQWFTSKTTIDMDHLELGIYFYRIQPKKGDAVTGKFTKL